MKINTEEVYEFSEPSLSLSCDLIDFRDFDFNFSPIAEFYRGDLSDYCGAAWDLRLSQIVQPFYSLGFGNSELRQVQPQ
jgi:hypothetical protein